MSTHAATLARERSIRLRLLLVHRAAAPLALALLSLALIAVTWNTWGNPGSDTGYDTLAGVRVAHGELPYVDFTYYYGPLAPFALGLASWLGGAGMWPAIGFGLVVALAIVFATFELGRSLAGPLGGFLAGALAAAVAFSPNELSFVDPHTSSATLAVLLMLCFVLFLRRFASTGGGAWVVAAGVCAGLVWLTRFEYVLAVSVTAVVWLGVRLHARLATRREVALFVAPAVGIPAAVYGAFLTAVSARRLLYENLYPRHFLHATGDVVLRARMPWTISSFVSLGAKLVLYALGVAALLWVARLLDRGGRLRVTVAGALGLALVIAVVASFADPEALRHGLKYAYGWIPAGAAIAAVWALWRAWRGRAASDATSQTELLLVVALAVVAATTYAGFFIEAFKPQMAAYALPLAAPLLVRLHLRRVGRAHSTVLLGALWILLLAAATTGLALKDASADSVTLHGPGGTIAVPRADAAKYRAAIAAIESRTRPGEPIFLAPQLTWLYTLTERSNPLPQLTLLPGVFASAADERAAIRRLDAADVRLAVVDLHPYTAYDTGSFGTSFDRVLAGWLRRDFTPLTTVAGSGAQDKIEVWTRRGS